MIDCQYFSRTGPGRERERGHVITDVVDPHVHHWHLSVNPWYPMLAEPAMSAIAHDYLAADYRADTAGYPVAGIVHISATSKPGAYLDEARWLEGLASQTRLAGGHGGGCGV